MPGTRPPYRVEMNVFSGSQGTYCGLNETKKKHDEVHLKVKTFQISMTMANIYFYRFFKCNKTPEIDCVLGTTSRVYSSGYFAFEPRLN